MKKYIFAFLSLLILGFVVGGIFYRYENAQIPQSLTAETTSPNTASAEGSPIKELGWEDLAKLDYKSGIVPPDLQALHGTALRVPGFFVPLSDNLLKITEFLLVPNAQACIHVPPPPPNLIVHVKLEKALTVDDISNPTWVEGTFFIETTESQFGKASYRISATKIEKYDWEKESQRER